MFEKCKQSIRNSCLTLKILNLHGCYFIGIPIRPYLYLKLFQQFTFLLHDPHASRYRLKVPKITWVHAIFILCPTLYSLHQLFSRTLKKAYSCCKGSPNLSIFSFFKYSKVMLHQNMLHQHDTHPISKLQKAHKSSMSQYELWRARYSGCVLWEFDFLVELVLS